MDLNFSMVTRPVERLRARISIDVGDVGAFADAIVDLDADRIRLDAMSVAARALVIERFDIRECVAGYQALYSRWRELYRARPAVTPVAYGSRLDQPWLPNPLVRFVRSTLRSMSR